ncbi:MAG: DUF547 domain-containing protein [Pseudomonadales bacterium]|jgi:hypothetical protein|nr:DUF547 domain-containing protein [Pseudomonadales bacterium]
MSPASAQHRFLGGCLLLLLLGSGAAEGALLGREGPIDAFAPEAMMGEAPSNEVSVGPWQAFLDQYLVTDDPSGIHRVRYAAVSEDDLAALDAWLEQSQAKGPTGLSRDAQMAYWINLYNALTVRLILSHPDVESIREIKAGLFSIGPWSMPLARVEGRDLSLDDIEHRILRPLFKDPRIHFAVNCASLGCPNLSAEAFRADTLDAQLDAGTRAYLTHPRGLRLENGRLRLSSIFDWYREDFPEGRPAFMAWLADYAPASVAARVRTYSGRITHDYDWTLNAP